MKRKLLIVFASAAFSAVAMTGAVMGQAVGEGPGWTGLTHPEDVIDARVQLMRQLNELIVPIDFYSAGDPGDLDALRINAEGISRLLTIVPHLFPPTTNLFDEAAELPATLALPAIWEDFDTFYDIARQGAALALEASMAADPETFRTLGLAIRDTCTACHDQYLVPYTPPAFDPADL